MRLWDKGIDTDSVMERLTVGDDPIYDKNLLRWDCIGSAAQAKVLHKASILDKKETNALLAGLKSLLVKADAGQIEITTELEDAHTAIENALISLVGDAGKKIHTGRSRNDQVLTALRLFMRAQNVEWIGELLEISEFFAKRFDELHAIQMPGYTHLQPAMPSSLGMWMHAFVEGALDLARDGFSLLKSLDVNPLGASAGFGSSLPLDREYSAKLLGFSRAQRSFIDIQNSRGRHEEKLLFLASQIGNVFEKFAWDVELYCTKEFGYIKLPDALTTGSSIMPQKKNPDIVELLRARCGLVRGYLAQLQWVTGKLPSNYHRDLQLSKVPLFGAIKEVQNIFDSLKLIINGFVVNKERISECMHDELYATYEAYRQVKDGVPFRDAYRKTALLVTQGGISALSYKEETALLQNEVNIQFEKSRSEKNQLHIEFQDFRRKLLMIETEVFSEI